MNISQWATRAYNHARLIANASPGRGSATRFEAQAADYVQRHLAQFRFQELQRQEFRGLRSIWFFAALVFGLAIMAHLAVLLLRPGLGDWPAWLVASALFLYAFWLFYRKFTFQDYPQRLSLPHGASQNVQAVIAPTGEVQQKVVLIGHLDSHRAVIWFAADALVVAYAGLSLVAMHGLWLAPLFYGLNILSGLDIFNWLGAALAFIHFFAWFSGVTADLGVFSPGANDNASAVGSLLGLAERLEKEPLQHTEVRLVFTGCEESGCDGMRAYLDANAKDLQDALFIDLELVGIGERLVYLQSEGLVRPRRIDPDVETLVQQVGALYPIQPISGANFGVFTEMGVVWERGLKGVCLLVLREDSSLLPEWHRTSDTAERLEPAAFERAHRFVWALLQKLDAKE